jgi:DNA polymerase III epsilon subunit-like protein
MATPPPTKDHKSKAVVLDCEMAGTLNGGSTLIQVCAIDYLTGEILLNHLVRPKEEVHDMRKQIHGITLAATEAAVASGVGFDGWEDARTELWKHIDSDTILIGHSLNHDLESLGILHEHVVDSFILAKEVFSIKGGYGLVDLSKECLGVDLRGKKGEDVHSCLDDVKATREVVLAMLKKYEAQLQKNTGLTLPNSTPGVP